MTTKGITSNVYNLSCGHGDEGPQADVLLSSAELEYLMEFPNPDLYDPPEDMGGLEEEHRRLSAKANAAQWRYRNKRKLINPNFTREGWVKGLRNPKDETNG